MLEFSRYELCIEDANGDFSIRTGVRIRPDMVGVRTVLTCIAGDVFGNLSRRRFYLVQLDAVGEVNPPYHYVQVMETEDRPSAEMLEAIAWIIAQTGDRRVKLPFVGAAQVRVLEERLLALRKTFVTEYARKINLKAQQALQADDSPMPRKPHFPYKRKRMYDEASQSWVDADVSEDTPDSSD